MRASLGPSPLTWLLPVPVWRGKADDCPPYIAALDPHYSGSSCAAAKPAQPSVNTLANKMRVRKEPMLMPCGYWVDVDLRRRLAEPLPMRRAGGNAVR